MLEMLAKGDGRFFISLSLKQIQNMQMLLAVNGITLAVLHGAIGEQPAHSIHPLDRIYEEFVAGRLDQRFMKPNASIMQLIGGIRFDATVQQVHLCRTAALEYLGIEPVARFE